MAKSQQTKKNPGARNSERPNGKAWKHGKTPPVGIVEKAVTQSKISKRKVH